jgi:hypothetical protein
MFHSKLQQSEAHDAVAQHKITQQAEEAITLSQGHSRQVAEKYYQMRNLRDAAVVAAETHEDLYGRQDVPNISSEEDGEYLPNPGDENEDEEVCTPIKGFSPKRKRLSWSHDEEEWILKWVGNHLKSPQYNSKINWKLCLKELRRDKLAKLFPEEHQDSTKIMECAKRLAKKHKKTIAEMCQQEGLE